MVTARRFTVIIEEKLLLKLLSFFGYGRTVAGGSLLLTSMLLRETRDNYHLDICRAGEGG